MKVLSPFGEYPFVFQRLERRGGALSVIGTVAGVESRVIFDGEDLRAAGRLLAVPIAGIAVALAVRRLRSRMRTTIPA
jgi:hypothetical protein